MARPCQGECAVFAAVPEMLTIAEACGSNARASLERAISRAACMDNLTCGPTSEDHVNCLCALRLTDAKIDQILDTIATPACGAD